MHWPCSPRRNGNFISSPNIQGKTMQVVSTFPFLIVVLALAACGGGGGSSGDSSGTTLSGVASKGPLDGASICAYALREGQRGDQIGSCATSDAAGHYRLDLADYRGDVLIEASGGSYIDEATGLSTPLVTPLRTLETDVAGGALSTAVTPLTEITTRLAEANGGLDRARFDAAAARVEREFGVDDIRHTLPANALQPDAHAAEAQRQYGLALAGIAQFQQTMASGLDAALDRVRACVNGTGTCGNDRIGLAVSQQRFIATHPDLYPDAGEAATGGGSGGACVVRATGNTASLCLMGLDASTQACNATSLAPLLNATLVDYFQGEVAYTSARRCGDEIHILWDVATRSVASRHMEWYRTDADGLVFVDTAVVPVSGNSGLMGNVSGSPLLASISATANVDVYGRLRISINTPEAVWLGMTVPALDQGGPLDFRITRAGSQLALKMSAN